MSRANQRIRPYFSHYMHASLEARDWKLEVNGPIQN
jgi:hypothetical protein